MPKLGKYATEGCNAFYADEDSTDCPYPEGSARHDWWVEGWYEACAEYMEA